jgi:hypothetical protein
MKIEKLKPLRDDFYSLLTDDEALLYALILVKQRAFGFSKIVGICTNVKMQSNLSIAYHLYNYVLGSFPIPSPNKKLSNVEAYYQRPLWKGAYGKARKAYLDILIVRVAEQVNKANKENAQ